MKVGLAQVDGKYPNLALMKLSAFHKNQGDVVSWWAPLETYDLVYASKVFVDTPDDPYLPADTVRGGPGYSLTATLPPEIEGLFPDYTIYPEWDAAIGFTTRGCPRRCRFCIVPEKEGPLEVVGPIYNFWDGQRRIVLLDNNLTAAPNWHFERICRQIIREGLRADFNQGLDIRLLKPFHVELLAKVRTFKRIHFAFDSVKHEQVVRDGIKMLEAGGVPRSRLMFYVLIGYDSEPEEDIYRVELLRSWGVDPFVMPYDRSDPYQLNFSRWVNMKAIFKTIPWEVYGPNRMRNEIYTPNTCAGSAGKE